MSLWLSIKSNTDVGLQYTTVICHNITVVPAPDKMALDSTLSSVNHFDAHCCHMGTAIKHHL